MILDSITITNFRSFTGEQKFVFPKEPGLYFMQGINEVEPRLGANGAGKSTIWEALTWCLFGKTSKGLKAGEVCNWEAKKGTSVVLQFFDHSGIGYTVTRTWGPITWKLRTWDVSGEHGDFDDEIDLAKDSSNPILSLLRLDFQPFLNCILTAQGQPMFLDQKPDIQAGLFSDVMGLDQWLEYASLAGSKSTAQDSISRVLEGRLSGYRGQLEGLAPDGLETSISDWEKERQVRLDRLADQHAAGVAKAKRIQAQIDGLKEQEAQQRALVAKLDGPLRDTKEAREQVLDALQDHRTKLAVDEKEWARLDHQLEHLTNEDHCPTCHQKLPKQDHQAQITVARKAWREVDARVRDHQDEIKRLGLVLKGLDRDLDLQEKSIRNDKEKMGELLDQLIGANRDLATLNKELDRIEDQAEDVEAEKNPFQDLQDKARRDAQDLQRKIEDTQRALDDSNYRCSLYSYWVRGFKELRLHLIAEALNELEIEVNSCVAALGLIDWELKFQVDKETKGGDIRRGFSVLVRSPHNRTLVPWAAWSGGEAQRLRLAATMGLANLIRSRSGTELDVEVWDEPTRDLSTQGVQDLLESLATRALQEQRVIWLVDHRTHAFGGFAGGVTVVKTKQGSKLVASMKEIGE